MPYNIPSCVPSLSGINGNDCIGDTRGIINTNFTNIANAVCNLSSTPITTSNTATIQHVLAGRNLSSNVTNGSLSAIHLANQTVTNAKIAFDGGSLGFRNKIINGNFDIWQRGTNFTTPAHLSYVADRWLFLKFTGNASSVSRGGFTVGQTDVPDTPKYYLRTTVSAAGDVCIGQRIEGVETLAGKTATYSFWIRAQSNTTLNQVVFEQMFGTGGGGSAIVNFNGSVNTPVTTNWTKITGTVNVPNINGKTKGVNPDDYLSIRIDIDETYTGWFDIAQVQLEEGSVATPFEQRPIGLELSLCQRYYQRYAAINIQGWSTTNTSVAYSAPLSVRMRIDPITNFTLGVTAPAGGVNTSSVFTAVGASADLMYVKAGALNTDKMVSANFSNITFDSEL